MAKIEENKEASVKWLMRLLAHDLLNPLSAAVFDVDLLMESEESISSSQQARLVRIQQSLTKMESLIRAFLQYENGEEAEILRTTICDMNEIARKTVADCKRIASGRNRNVWLRTSDEALLVKGDSFLLHQAIGNLVTNALKHTPADSDIIVSTFAGADTCGIRVHDTGPGIPKAKQEKIFEPFTSLSSQMSEQCNGLGLTLVRWITTQHGGTITLKSAPKAGTTFTLKLNRLYPAHSGPRMHDRIPAYQ